MKFLGITVVSLVVVGVVGFVYLANLHNGESLSASQKEKALANLLGRAPLLTPTNHTTWNLYKSSAVSFLYPGWATIYTKDNEASKKQQNTLDSFHFLLPDQHIQGIVSASEVAISRVSDDSGVRLRLQDSSYERVGDSTTTAAQFFNQENMERSYFLLKNGNLYVVVVTGGENSDNQEIFEKIKASLE